MNCVTECVSSTNYSQNNSYFLTSLPVVLPVKEQTYFAYFHMTDFLVKGLTLNSLSLMKDQNFTSTLDNKSPSLNLL